MLSIFQSRRRSTGRVIWPFLGNLASPKCLSPASWRSPPSVCRCLGGANLSAWRSTLFCMSYSVPYWLRGSVHRQTLDSVRARVNSRKQPSPRLPACEWEKPRPPIEDGLAPRHAVRTAGEQRGRSRNGPQTYHAAGRAQIISGSTGSLQGTETTGAF